LILSVSGAEAAHVVWINGQPAARVPLAPEGTLCTGEPVYLDIPADVVVQGENIIEITSDALAGDRWTAARCGWR
jgi:hypothetical protein